MTLKPTRDEIEASVVSIAESLSSDPTGRVLMTLDALQARFGYVPKEALVSLSGKLGVPVDQLDHVCDFFVGFSTEPLGEHVIEVCDGTACHMQRAPEIIQLLEKTLGIEVGHTTPDGRYTLRTVRCVGSCGSAPIASVDGKMLAKVSLADAAQMTRYADAE